MCIALPNYKARLLVRLTVNRRQSATLKRASEMGAQCTHEGGPGEHHSSSMHPNSGSNYSGVSGGLDPSSYGAHSLSDLNWSSDPVAAIEGLIGKMPSHAQSVLNASMQQMPLQMGRAAGAGANTQMMQGQPFMVDPAGFGYQGAEHYGDAAAIQLQLQQPINGAWLVELEVTIVHVPLAMVSPARSLVNSRQATYENVSQDHDEWPHAQSWLQLKSTASTAVNARTSSSSSHMHEYGCSA